MATIISEFSRFMRPHAAWTAELLTRLVTQWLTRRRERLALAELDDRLLRDIGIDRQSALREAGRPFWDGEPWTGAGWRRRD